MAEFYVFMGTTGTAQMVTDDRSGKKLPPHPAGEWVFFKTININPGDHLIGAAADSIFKNVAKDGYHRWPESPTSQDPESKHAQPTSPAGEEG